MNRKMRLLTTVIAVAAAPLFVLSLACGGGGGGNTPSQPDDPPEGDNVVTVNLDDFEFSPRRVRVQPGQTVRFVLRGSDPTHTATAKDGRFDSGSAFDNPGDTFEVAFNAQDDDMTYEYACTSHEDCCDMRGSILVGDNAPTPDERY